ncbi:MAG: hydantoinase/oxoprolinase N-terminal domain-containing protein [Brevinema sp.]
MRIGIDVGGTHTDAVLLNGNGDLLSSCKVATSQNVVDGIRNALIKLLSVSGADSKKIKSVMLGSTHCVNAILQRKGLAKVGVIRISGPASTSIPPMASWPKDLIDAIGSHHRIIDGGFEFNGAPIAPLSIEQAKDAIKELSPLVEGFAVIGAFSAVNATQEEEIGKLIEELSGKPYVLSHQIGSLGLLERENASILNMSLTHVAKTTIQALESVLKEQNLPHVDMYFCQNDGTVMSLEFALKYPILSIACGPTNSIRGASIVTGKSKAVIVDIGGTSSDVGMIIDSFPRESALAKDIGGCRTNFRMPDLISIGLGGGSIVREENGEMLVGPKSVAFQLTEKALIFGGDTLTTTDIAVRLGMANIGDPSKVEHISLEFAQRAMDKISDMLIEAIEQIKTSAQKEDIILVGGGSIIADQKKLSSIGNIILPENFGVANAIGAASASAGGEVEKIYSYEQTPRDIAMKELFDEACALATSSGADKSTLTMLFKEEVPLAYLPGNAVRVKIKVVGDLILK